MAVMDKQIHDPLPSPSQWAQDLPKPLTDVIIQSLSKQPKDRFLDMAEIAAALDGLTMADTTPRHTPEMPGKPSKPDTAAKEDGKRQLTTAKVVEQIENLLEHAFLVEDFDQADHYYYHWREWAKKVRRPRKPGRNVWLTRVSKLNKLIN